MVLVVGAGPSGLVLALWLARSGVPVRLVEKNSGPGQASRAIVVQARTLEFYRQLGIADEVVNAGIRIEDIHLREGAHEVTSVPIGGMGEGVSPYPFALSYPQDDHEKLLGEHVTAAGVTTEWNTELVRFEDHGDRVVATLKKGDAEETAEFDYLCGADGARSTVRQRLGFGFEGGTYDQMFYVADVEATGAAATDGLNICLGAAGFLIVTPVRSSSRFRLIGIIPQELVNGAPVSFEEIQPFAERMIGIQVQKVHWFSTYHVHHRVAEHFRRGRVFLLGDAGHIHSPAGGQGMNTGIGDAVNLGWKLAAVAKGEATDVILETYEPERITFAHSLVETTDRVFRAAIAPGKTSEFIRTALVPHLIPFAFGFSAVRSLMFGVVSQTRINYEKSELSDGRAGDLHGGDRLPWVESLANFGALKTRTWQLHVYGEASVETITPRTGIPVVSFPWNEEAGKAGIGQNTLLLVRPDGYVAWAGEAGSRDGLPELLAKFGIDLRPKA